MRTITTSKGVNIELDGDVLAVLEALFDTLWENPDDYSYEDVRREIQHLMGQLTPEERDQYLVEAMHLTYNTYENGRSDRVIRKLDALGTTEP